MFCPTVDTAVTPEGIYFERENANPWMETTIKKESLSYEREIAYNERLNSYVYSPLKGHEYKYIGNNDIKSLKIVYNKNGSIKKSGVDMNKSQDSSSYLEKCIEGLEKYIDVSKQNNQILSIDINRKVKASEILREISKNMDSDITTKYSKNTVVATLEFAARVIDGCIKENDFQKSLYSLLKYILNSSDEHVETDKIIKIKESQIDQFVENTISLDSFLKLKDDWNRNGANGFSKEIIETMRNLIKELPYQPEIFPTGCGSIQFEYEKEDGSYLEFELFEDNKLKIFTLSNDDREKTEIQELDVSKVIKVVSEFYE